MKRRHDLSRCPTCSERVTPFAAGCAICGTDLDIGRFDGGPTVTQRAGSFFAALSAGPSVGRPRRAPSTLAEYALWLIVLSLLLAAAGAVLYAVATVAGA